MATKKEILHIRRANAYGMYYQTIEEIKNICHTGDCYTIKCKCNEALKNLTRLRKHVKEQGDRDLGEQS